jgi:hypothetical protein
MRLARNIVAGLLLLLGALFTFTGNVGLWVDRTVYDTDGFTSTVTRTLEDDDVQLAIAERFSNRLILEADLNARIADQLPTGLGFLSLPLTDAVHDFLVRITLRVLNNERIDGLIETAVREFHTVVINVIEGKRGGVETNRGELVIDLRPVLESVVEEVSGREVTIPDETPQLPQNVLDQLPDDIREQLEGREGGLLGDLQLSEDAGRFVIEDKAISWAYTIARYGQDIIWIVIGIAVALIVLSIIIATDRRSMIRNVGITLIVVGVISLALLVPVRLAGQEFAKSPDAALAIINILTEDFRYQSFAMVGIGVFAALGAVLAGPTRLARGLRSTVSRSASAVPGESLPDIAREHANILRLAGLVIGALLLIAWPDPTARVYVTILGLLAVYLGAIWMASSDSESAQRARQRGSELWQQHFAAPVMPATGDKPTRLDWIVARAAWFRMTGILVVVALLLVWPSPTWGSVIMLIALLLVYLAALEFISQRRSPEP